VPAAQRLAVDTTEIYERLLCELARLGEAHDRVDMVFDGAEDVKARQDRLGQLDVLVERLLDVVPISAAPA
jgi:hypothetical protein